MRKSLQKPLIIVFVLLLPICAFAQFKGVNPFESAQPSDWTGTGFALKDGYVVTNFHVVDGARTIKLTFYSNDALQEYVGDVVATDDEKDLAIIKINDASFKGLGNLPYSVKTQLSDVGEYVFVLGYPMTQILGDEIKLTTGVLSSKSGYQGDMANYQISAPVQPGNSGGPLFDAQGNVIGVVCAKVSDAENVGYAIKASYLETLAGKISSGLLPANGNIAQLSLPEKVKRVQPYICFIKCTNRVESPRSTNPKTGSSIIPKGSKVIENPYVDYTTASTTRIKKVTITNNETIVDMAAHNTMSDGSYFNYVSISKETYIKIDDSDRKYVLEKAEGIAVSPDKTEYEGQNKTIVFKLHFKAIPKSVTSISLIEPGESDWRFYGISLKD